MRRQHRKRNVIQEAWREAFAPRLVKTDPKGRAAKLKAKPWKEPK
jgi:hypothetical protein